MLLGNAILYWLNYVAITSENADILAESSVRYPLAEYIERRIKKDVALEYNHPLNTRKRIDFMFPRDKDEQAPKIGSGRTYIELKYARKNTAQNNEIQRIFDDLARLSLVSENNACYFIMCGSTTNFQCYFEGKGINYEEIISSGKIILPEYSTGNNRGAKSGTDYQRWFEFEFGNGGKIIDMNLQENKKFADDFKEKFSIGELNNIKTELIYIEPKTDNDSQTIFGPQKVAIWQVSAIK